jgi:transposase InsO family protein
MPTRRHFLSALSSIAAFALFPFARKAKAADPEPEHTVLYVFSTTADDGTRLGRGWYRAQPVNLTRASASNPAINARFVPAGKPVLAMNLMELDALQFRYVDVTTDGRYVWACKAGDGRYAFSHIDHRTVGGL